MAMKRAHSPYMALLPVKRPRDGGAETMGSVKIEPSDGFSPLQSMPANRQMLALGSESSEASGRVLGANIPPIKYIPSQKPVIVGQHWQIRCLKQKPSRPELCSYLGFRNTSELEAWEQSLQPGWMFLTQWKRGSDEMAFEVEHIIAILCEGGKRLGEVLAWIEEQEPWESLEGPGLYQAVNTCSVISPPWKNVSRHLISIIDVAAMAVWLIRSSPNQFPDSSPSGSKPTLFHYAPEDVNRAFRYLYNLRHFGFGEVVQPRQTINFAGPPPGARSASYYSQGTISLPYQQSRGPTFMHRHLSAASGYKNGEEGVGEEVGVALGQPAAAAVPLPTASKAAYLALRPNFSPEIGALTVGLPPLAYKKREQLINLRAWVYSNCAATIGTSLLDESVLDMLFDHARAQISIGEEPTFDGARVAIKVYVWFKGTPRGLTEEGEWMLQQLRLLQCWLYDHGVGDGTDAQVEDGLQDAVAAIVAGDRDAFDRKRAELKETMSNMKSVSNRT